MHSNYPMKCYRKLSKMSSLNTLTLLFRILLCEKHEQTVTNQNIEKVVQNVIDDVIS